MSDIIDTLHPKNQLSDNLYPNIKASNIPTASISMDKLDSTVKTNIGSLRPSGVDTSTNILAFTSNKGVYVGSDTGDWYYWNGSSYISGGKYISDGSYDELKEDLSNASISTISNCVNSLNQADFSDYDIETGSCTRKNENFIDANGFKENHIYRLISNYKARTVGTRGTSTSSYSTDLGEQTYNDSGYYYLDFTWLYGNYFVGISDSHSDFKFAIYDLTNVLPSFRVYANSIFAIRTQSENINNIETAYLKNNIRKIKLTANKMATYDEISNLVTITSGSFPGVKFNEGMIAGRKYRIIIEYDFSSTNEQIGIVPSSYSSFIVHKKVNIIAGVPQYIDVEWESTYQNDYEFVIVNASKFYVAVYDITDVDEEYLPNVDKISAYSLEKNESIFSDGISNNKEVLCFGDSLTQGAGSTSGKDYPSVLKSLLDDYHVKNYGIGGENSLSIAMRQGGMPLLVDPFTIPASTDPVEISLSSTSNYPFTSLINQRSVALNPCEISGITGNITYSNSKYYFTRIEEGDSVIVSRPSKVYTYASNIKDDITVIWIGTNDSSEGINVADLIINIAENMISHNTSNKYIVLGLTAKTILSEIENVNYKLANHFGNHFLDIRKYILSYGLADEGITPTSQDETDIANGEMPTSLRNDSIHFNDHGYNVIANQVYKKGQELGYWD